MVIRTQENYKTDANAVVRPAIDLRILVSTLFNILAGTYLRRERVNTEIHHSAKPNFSIHSCCIFASNACFLPLITEILKFLEGRRFF